MPTQNPPETTITAQKTDAPEWLVELFAAIDAKRFDDPAFDVIAEDAVLRFGIIEVDGRDAIRRRLAEFDGESETHHHFLEYWDLGATKAFLGRIDVTDVKTGETTSPFLCHLWQMSDDGSRVIALRGAVGPLGNIG